MSEKMCSNCPLGKMCYVPSSGPDSGCNLMIVGTAPGLSEAMAGQPFMGKTGEVIREIVEGLGLTDSTYFTNLIHRRPLDADGKNRKPSAQEVHHCGRHVSADIARLKPDLIVAVGSTPLNFLIGQKVPSIKLVHGLTMRAHMFDMRISVLPVYDPAYVARSGGILSSVGQEWVTDMRSIGDLLEVGIG